MMGQIKGRDNAEAIRSEPFRPFQKTDRIVESVMGPMNERGLGIHVEGDMVKPQIVAVVRPQHQAVTRKADRITVGILGRVNDADPCHASP